MFILFRLNYLNQCYKATLLLVLEAATVSSSWVLWSSKKKHTRFVPPSLKEASVPSTWLTQVRLNLTEEIEFLD